jgi:hypothetical protein
VYTPHRPGTLNATGGDLLQDSQFLPDWLRTIPATSGSLPPAPMPAPAQPPVAARPAMAPATPAPAQAPLPAPLFAHGAPAKPGPRWVVPCPHCGEPMDLEMLIQQAD